MKKVTSDDSFENEKNQIKHKQKRKAKLKPYKRNKYKNYDEYEDVQF